MMVMKRARARETTILISWEYFLTKVRERGDVDRTLWNE
jgi:hypothetical protein